MKKTFSISELSSIFGVHYKTLEYHLRHKHITGQKVFESGRKKWLIPQEEVFKLFKILTKEIIDENIRI